MEKNVWILVDNRIGSNNQARGVAAALGWKTEEKQIFYNKWANLPNLLLGASLMGVEKRNRKILKPPFPDLVIAASRRTAPIARWIKKQTFGQTKIVQIMHPGSVGLKDFDRVFVSEHDKNKAKSPNIHYIAGSVHRIVPQLMAEEQLKWENAFAHLPRPLTAVIIGGTYKGHEFNVENAAEFGRNVKWYKESIGGSLLITDSRRTGENSQHAIMNEIGDIPNYAYLWGKEEGQNPYLGYLACADDIIVTGDSVSMCCEACGTGKKVQIFCGKNWLDKKHYNFVKSLRDKQLAFLLGETIPDNIEYKAYNPAFEVANEIEKLFSNNTLE